MSQPQPQVSADGRFYFDGQAWKPLPAASPPPVRRVQGLIVLAGAVVVIAGSFLPWITATAPFVGTISRSLIDGGGDGIALDVLAGVVLLIGLAMSVRGPLRLGGGLAIVAAILAAVIVVIDFNDMQSRVTNATNTSNLIIASVGAGPYVSGLGLIVAVIGSAMAVAARGGTSPTNGYSAPAVLGSVDANKFSAPPSEAGSRLGARSSDGAWYWNGERWLPNS